MFGFFGGASAAFYPLIRRSCGNPSHPEIAVRRGYEGADHFLELAGHASVFIAQHPFAGPHPHWATRHKSLRFWVISKTRFLIYYLVEEDTVSIERVLSGRRDVRRMMEIGLEDPPIGGGEE